MRTLPLGERDRREMLAAIGVSSIDALYAEVPPSARREGLLDLPKAMPEMEVERRLSTMAARNVTAGSAPFFIGGGAYRHYLPAAVDHLIQRGEFLTSYTPYQPEISQGTLQALFEFQTLVTILTGMEVANASLYDGATACAEAVMMANRLTGRKKTILSGGLHPHYREVVETYGRFVGFRSDAAPPAPGAREDLAPLVDRDTGSLVVQVPDFWGELADASSLAQACHEAGALLVVVVNEALSLGLVRPPGEMGADIVAGEGQSLGNPLSFGGPHLGLFATRERFERQMPGRLVGETVDSEGRRGFVLTLSAREQHIRREKATSNICTNSGLCALAFTIHLSLLGEKGLKTLARLNHEKALQLCERLQRVDGVQVLNRAFFNEFTLRLPCAATPVVERLAERGILAGIPASRPYPDRAELSDLLIVAATETTSEEDMARLEKALAAVLR